MNGKADQTKVSAEKPEAKEERRKDDSQQQDRRKRPARKDRPPQKPEQQKPEQQKPEQEKQPAAPVQSGENDESAKPKSLRVVALQGAGVSANLPVSGRIKAINFKNRNICLYSGSSLYAFCP